MELWALHAAGRRCITPCILLLMLTAGAAAQGNCAISNTCNPATQQCDPITGICW